MLKITYKTEMETKMNDDIKTKPKIGEKEKVSDKNTKSGGQKGNSDWGILNSGTLGEKLPIGAKGEGGHSTTTRNTESITRSSENSRTQEDRQKSGKEEPSIVRIVPIVMHDGNTIGKRNKENNDSKKQNGESSSTDFETKTFRKINEISEFSQLTNHKDDYIEIIAVVAENKDKKEECKQKENLLSR